MVTWLHSSLDIKFNINEAVNPGNNEATYLRAKCYAPKLYHLLGNAPEVLRRIKPIFSIIKMITLHLIAIKIVDIIS